MTAIIFIALLLYLLSCQPYRRNVFRTGEYMSFQRTSMLNGCFILIVFLSHAFSYLPAGSELNMVDLCGRMLCGLLGQLMVAGFFYYSGFGIMESITRKGQAYLDQFPRQRFFKVLLHFDIAVLCFWLLAWLINKSYDWETILLAYTGWTSIGNSNWFICVTLLLYLITYISFRWCGRWRWLTLWGGSFMLILALMVCGKGSWWYDTLLCFPAGMLFSHVRQKVERFLARSRIPVELVGMLCVLVAVFTCRFPAKHFGPLHFLPANLAAILMAYGSVLLLSGFDLKKSPRVLLWMGASLFSIYIFQRIPMRALAETTDLEYSPFLFLLVNLVLTLLIAFASGLFFKWLDNICFSSKK